jgi:RND family efflux transporter MFP subunit
MKLNHPKSLFIVCVFPAIALLVGCQGEPAGSAGPEHPTVGVVQPELRPVVDYAYFTGQIKAVDNVDLRARVTGYLKKICYDPGTIVAKDTVLFEIDPLQYQAQVDMAKGKLAEAKAQVSEAEAKVMQAEAQVAVDRTRLAIDREVAKTSGAISKLKLEEDEAKVKESEASLAQCKASVLALKASVEGAEANLTFNQQNLDWTKVKSPIAGRVDRNFLTEGNLVTADVTILTNIIAAEDVYVYFDVDELNCLEIQEEVRQGGYQPKDVPIAVALQNEKDFRHEGSVDVVANGLNESTGTLKVRGILNNKKKLLTPGNFVRVRIAVDMAHERLLIPDCAVIPKQGETFVLVVGKDNKIEDRKVTIGGLDPNDKTLRVVENGLKAGELVVVEGRQHVRKGMPVEVKQVAISKNPLTVPKTKSPTPKAESPAKKK